MKRIIILCVVTLLLSVCTGCVSVYNPATGRKEHLIFDDKAEVNWGTGMAKQFTQKLKILDDPQLVNALQEMGDKVGATSHRNYLQYHFYIIDEDKINAFACPGGHIFFYKGLLDAVDEDQVAFVIAHEIGHVNAKHAVKALGAQMGFSILNAVLVASSGQQDTQKSAEQLFLLVNRGYSREDEYQADALGLDYMLKAGYSPQGALDLFSLFRKMEQESASKGQVQPTYLSTHPRAEDRATAVKKKLKELGR